MLADMNPVAFVLVAITAYCFYLGLAGLLLERLARGAREIDEYDVVGRLRDE